MLTKRSCCGCPSVIGRHRTRDIGPTCGSITPAAALAAATQPHGTSAWMSARMPANPAAPPNDCTTSTGRWPTRSATAPQAGAVSPLATASAPALAPPAP
ncbi:hypothetical protein [Nocardioides alcanivorans]|uniref:hypothetical protein n=1 Tax=Nocardioides alcanivorans TaxID=2897352 RepID=UPI001F2952F3|nr:hypothetical protein [Nocardioides alcanivorans]